MKRFFVVFCLIVFGFFGCGGSDKSSSSSDTGSAVDVQFSESVSYLDEGKGIESQMREENFPKVGEREGGLYVLDVSSWPLDWKIGSVVLVEVEGVLEYKRIVFRFELKDGRFAIGGLDASMLEAVSSLNVGSGNVSRAVSSGGFSIRDLLIANEANVSLYRDSNVSVGFSSVKLVSDADVEWELDVDAPRSLIEAGVLVSEIIGFNDSLRGLIDSVGGSVVGDGADIVLSASRDVAFKIIDALLKDSEFGEVVSSARRALSYKSRIRKMYFSIDGELRGDVDVFADVFASGMGKREISFCDFLFPLAGVIPAYLEFELVGEVGFDFSGEVNFSSGAEVMIPVEYKIDVVDGEVVEFERGSDRASLTFDPIDLSDIEVGVDFHAGLQVEVGPSVLGLVEVSVDPVVSAVFDVDVSSDCLRWDVFADVDVESEVEILGDSYPVARVDLFEAYRGVWPGGEVGGCSGVVEVCNGVDDDLDGVVDEGCDVGEVIVGGVWVQVTDNASWSAREGHTSVVFDDRMWIIGGHSDDGYKNDVWSSSNGRDWYQVVENAPWSERSGHTSVVFDDRMWVIGGRNGGVFYNDVWYSYDGAEWVLATSDASWRSRVNHTSVVFDDRMWVIGGSFDQGGGRASDVWRSSNGRDWFLVVESAPWGERSGHASVVFNGQIYVAGGVSSSLRNDVWSSSNGVDWARVLLNASWSRRSEHVSVVFDNEMWIVGGAGGAVDGTDSLWHSFDAIEWVLGIDYGPGGGGCHSRGTGHTSIVFDNRLWLIGGRCLSVLYLSVEALNELSIN